MYYTDFVMELTLLSLDLMHHIHMLVWSTADNAECLALKQWVLDISNMYFSFAYFTSQLLQSSVNGEESVAWGFWHSFLLCNCNLHK